MTLKTASMLASKPSRGSYSLATSLRQPVFLLVLGLMGGITILHHVLDDLLLYSGYYHVHFALPILYVFPVVLSGLYLRYEVARLTAVLAVVFAMPAIVKTSPANPTEWITELAQLVTGVAIGLTLSRLMAYGAAQYQQAQETSALFTLLHEQLAKAQEEERQRISRELHDETAQRLIVLCRSLDTVAATLRLPRAAAEPFQELRMIAEEVLADVRRFSRGLRPPVLDDLGLVPAIQWLATESAKRGGCEVRVEVTGSQRRLLPETELALFRIVQEALHNVEKHAEASLVVIGLFFAEGSLHLSICDDGKGFQMPASLSSLLVEGKLGLVGMQERVHLLGGSFDLQTEVDGGTCIAVTIPQLVRESIGKT